MEIQVQDIPAALRDNVVKEALDETRGARFYKCALQVNPYKYAVHHASKTEWADEASYNKAMVEALVEAGVEVIGITDHFRFDETARNLSEVTQEAGIHVFPGFEASTDIGIHFLCLFDPNTSIREIQDSIASCEIRGEIRGPKSPRGDIDSRRLLRKCREKWNAIGIAAHITSNNGMLMGYTGDARASNWTNPELIAAAIPGSVDDLPQGYRDIVTGSQPEYRRERPVALINACDVTDPEDIAKSGATTFVKMSEVTVEGLRQAFLDPESRIRLNSDPLPEEHAEFVAMGWEGGFLDGVRVHFNENLNVLVGGRGTGKSTIIESLRYVLGLEAIGEEAQKAHDSVVRNVLQSGTKVTLLVRRHVPSQRHYLITRTVPNPPTVRDEEGNVLNVSPSDVIPDVEIYGQHEISELAKDEAKLTRLLQRFTAPETSTQQRRTALTFELEKSRKRLLDLQREEEQVEERLRELPAVEETLKQYESAGLEEKLGVQSRLIREERIIAMARERIDDVKKGLGGLREVLPLDRAFLSEKALNDLPNQGILAPLNEALARLESAVSAALAEAESQVSAVESEVTEVHEQWGVQRDAARENYEKSLRELQKDKIDGEEFIRLRRQIETLRPLNDRLSVLRRERKQAEQRRRNLLLEWEETKRETYAALQRAAQNVNQRLGNRVKVDVKHQGDRMALRKLLDDAMSGPRKPILDLLDVIDGLSLPVLADACKDGRNRLQNEFGLTKAQAQRLADIDIDTILRIEELDLPSTTQLRLNIAAEGQEAEWRTLNELSTGQRATAILLLLLLESQAPLVVDQPEDDLDNRFISDDVVPAIRQEKKNRQFVFATHNANIPVLGDAELILGLTSKAEHGMIPDEHRGAIDKPSISHLIGEILEGGKAAFEWRRLKYGF